MFARLTKRRRQRLLRAWRAQRGRADTDYAEPAGVVARGRRRAPTPPVRAWLRRLAATPSRLAGAAGAAAIGLFLVHTATSGAYRVRGATVSGNERVPADEVYAVSGIEGGWALALDVEAAERRIEALEDVRRAHVAVRLPARVAIGIEETAAVLLWRTPAASLAVDENGRAIGAPPEAPGVPGAIEVDDTSGVLGAPGDRLPAGTVEAAVAYAARFGALEYRDAVGFVARSAEGWELRLGADAARAGEQAELAGRLAESLGGAGRRVAFIDLRFGRRPYYRLAADD